MEAMEALLARAGLPPLPPWAAAAPPAALAAGLLGVLLLGLLLLTLGRRLLRDERDTVLLAGPCGAGKTSLFVMLRDGSVHAGSHTSMEPNIGRFVLSGEMAGAVRPVQLVDLPGHPRLRPLLENHVGSARAVLFLLDAAEFLPTARATAEQLYELLRHRAIARRRVPVLIACNKTDRPQAHSVEFIRKRLEKEIEALRTTVSSMSDTQGQGGGGEAMLGTAGVPFALSQCPSPVSVCEAAVKDGQNLLAIKAFIREQVKP